MCDALVTIREPFPYPDSILSILSILLSFILLIYRDLSTMKLFIIRISAWEYQEEEEFEFQGTRGIQYTKYTEATNSN